MGYPAFRICLWKRSNRPLTNPSFLYGTAKTQKFNNPFEITKENLKLRPIVSTCDTFYYETARYLASYLLSLTDNEYSIKTTTDFANRLNNRTLDDDEVLVSCDVSSLFTEVPLDDTIDYIKEMYMQSKLPQLSSNLLFGAFSVVSPKTQCSVSTVASTNKLTDVVWETLYPQSAQIFSWPN